MNDNIFQWLYIEHALVMTKLMMMFNHYKIARHDEFVLNMWCGNTTQCLWLRTKTCRTHSVVLCCIQVLTAYSSYLCNDMKPTYLVFDHLIYIRLQKEIVLPSSGISEKPGWSVRIFVVLIFFFFLKKHQKCKNWVLFSTIFLTKTPNMNKIGCFSDHNLVFY